MLKSVHRSLFSTMNPTSKSAAKKEAKRLEKGLELAAKGPKASARKPAPKSTRDVDTTEFVNTTPKGDKKGYYSFIYYFLFTGLIYLFRSITADGGWL